MNLKVADEATKWARTIVDRNGGEIPDWGAYRKHVNEKTGASYGTTTPVPREYHYAYLRVKGLSHAAALDRLDLTDKPASNTSQDSSRRWWQFW